MGSAGVGHGPVFDDGAHVRDDLSVVGPGHLDRVVSADSGAARVSARAEPMVLGSTSGAGSPSLVSSSVDCLAEDFVGEDGVVGDDGGG